MERYFKRKSVSNETPLVREANNDDIGMDYSKKNRVEFNVDELQADPGIRKKISEYHPNFRDEIRRAYLQKGPCQPREHDFPQKKIGQVYRRFVPEWFDEYKSWLEYSIEKDAAFCLYCYLFRP